MNLGEKALQILKTIAPTIALAVGGPFEPIAVAVLHAALGTTDVKSAENALLSATPEQLLSLKQANQTFQLKMKELGVSEDKLAFDDTANARLMAMTTKDATPRNLSYMLLFFTGLIITAEFFGLSKIEGTLAGTLIGYLISENKAVMQFWFGTTKGSQDKDVTISDIAKQP